MIYKTCVYKTTCFSSNKIKTQIIKLRLIKANNILLVSRPLKNEWQLLHLKEEGQENCWFSKKKRTELSWIVVFVAGRTHEPVALAKKNSVKSLRSGPVKVSASGVVTESLISPWVAQWFNGSMWATKKNSACFIGVLVMVYFNSYKTG